MSKGFAEHYRRLKGLEQSRTEPSDCPVDLLHSEIQVLPQVFQPRTDLGNEVSEVHVLDLVKAISLEPAGVLDPLSVWWSGEAWILVDGHHRYEAYRRFYSERRALASLRVPVVGISGTVSDALSASIAENGKARLMMGKADRLDVAWRLVCSGERNRNKIAPRCGVGPSTVQAMMNRLREIVEIDPDVSAADLAERGWAEARTLGKPERAVDDEWANKVATEWARRLGKTFGDKLAKNPALLLDALVIYSENMTLRLYERMDARFGHGDEDGDY
jgi:ParB-like chromosome segregation protein Spo0J